MTDAPDSDRIARYLDGDLAALEELVEKYRRPLFGYIVNMTAGRGDADEIFQETWFRALRRLHAFRQENLFGWLARIAHNYVIDRARRRKPDLSMDAVPADGGQSLGDQLADPAPAPDANAAARDLAGRVQAAVDRLPPEQREVFLLRSQGGLAFKEIAAVQKVSINTALARMQYALGKLRSMLREDYDGL